MTDDLKLVLVTMTAMLGDLALLYSELAACDGSVEERLALAKRAAHSFEATAALSKRIQALQ